MAQRAADRVGETVEVLVEEVSSGDGRYEGRAAHQAPGRGRVDDAARQPAAGPRRPGDRVGWWSRYGADLVARA